MVKVMVMVNIGTHPLESTMPTCDGSNLKESGNTCGRRGRNLHLGDTRHPTHLVLGAGCMQVAKAEIKSQTQKQF
jgi:hypothetical protein